VKLEAATKSLTYRAATNAPLRGETRAFAARLIQLNPRADILFSAEILRGFEICLCQGDPELTVETSINNLAHLEKVRKVNLIDIRGLFSKKKGESTARM